MLESMCSHWSELPQTLIDSKSETSPCLLVYKHQCSNCYLIQYTLFISPDNSLSLKFNECQFLFCFGSAVPSMLSNLRMIQRASLLQQKEGNMTFCFEFTCWMTPICLFDFCDQIMHESIKKKKIIIKQHSIPPVLNDI